MSDSNAPISDDARRLLLEERKQALEESWPKKWGAVTLGAAASLLVAVLTSGLAYWQHDVDAQRAVNDAKAKTEAAAVAADNDLKQKKLENDRQAVTLYFQYLAEKPENDPTRPNKIGLLASIASDPDILSSLITAKVDSVVDNGGAPSDAVRGSTAPTPLKSTYGFGDFTAYIQAARDDTAAANTAAELLADARDLGFKTPGIQRVARVPNLNQIRIYKPQHLKLAQSFAKALATRGSGNYCIVQLPNPQSLPDGIIEAWVGKHAPSLPGLSCS